MGTRARLPMNQPTPQPLPREELVQGTAPINVGPLLGGVGVGSVDSEPGGASVLTSPDFTLESLP